MFSPDSPISEFVSISTHVAPSVLKTTGGDYLLIWHLAGLPFVGRDEFELEQRHNTFNRLVQTLRAPDFANVAFWVHDVRRRRKIGNSGRFKQSFNQALSDEYYAALSSQKIMQNELYFSMIYRPVVTGKRLVEKSGDPDKIRVEEEQAIAKVIELATNVEAVLKDYSPYRLGMYEAKNGVVFSETLEFLGYLLNRIDEPVPVLQAPVAAYLPVSKHMFANKTGDFVIRTPDGINHFGAILNVKEYADGTYPGILNGLKYLDFEYVVTHSFSPVGRHDALKVLERTKGMMISSGDKSSSQIRDLDLAMDDVASGNFVLGEYHFTVAVYSDSQEKLARQIATTRAELSNAGFVSSKEDLAIASSFYSQLPGNWRFRTRIANLSSLNFLGLSPLHNFAQGKQHNNPWGDALCRLPMASRITLISMQLTQPRIPWAKKLSETRWSSASRVLVRRR